MKTVTEFPGVNLKNAIKLKQDLIAGGKTAEELPQAMGESLKLEGERLDSLLTALEMVEKKSQDLKRVVVYTLAEGEKAPTQLLQKGDRYYLAEYYPSLEKKHPPKDFKGDPGKKGKRRGGRRGKPKNAEGRDFKPAGEGQPNPNRRPRPQVSSKPVVLPKPLNTSAPKPNEDPKNE
jgi:hypothetical protein